MVAWRSAGGEGILLIADGGAGGGESFSPVAFDRFARRGEARKCRPNPDPATGTIPLPGGSGLGLATVRAVAARAGGTASLRNVRSGGHEVTIRIPEVQ